MEHRAKIYTPHIELLRPLPTPFAPQTFALFGLYSSVCAGHILFPNVSACYIRKSGSRIKKKQYIMLCYFFFLIIPPHRHHEGEASRVILLIL